MGRHKANSVLKAIDESLKEHGLEIVIGVYPKHKDKLWFVKVDKLKKKKKLFGGALVFDR